MPIHPFSGSGEKNSGGRTPSSVSDSSGKQVGRLPGGCGIGPFLLQKRPTECWWGRVLETLQHLPPHWVCPAGSHQCPRAAISAPGQPRFPADQRPLRSRAPSAGGPQILERLLDLPKPRNVLLAFNPRFSLPLPSPRLVLLTPRDNRKHLCFSPLGLTLVFQLQGPQK